MMAMFERLIGRVELRARAAVDHALGGVEQVAGEFPDIMVRREDDRLIISGRGLLRRWLTDVRLRFAYWRGR
jgi:hypothetical protein